MDIVQMDGKLWNAEVSIAQVMKEVTDTSISRNLKTIKDTIEDCRLQLNKERVKPLTEDNLPLKECNI